MDQFIDNMNEIYFQFTYFIQCFVSPIFSVSLLKITVCGHHVMKREYFITFFSSLKIERQADR